METGGQVHHEYTVAFFDILGFKRTSERLGLAEVERRYRALIEVVDRFNANSASLFGLLNFEESAYWTEDGDIFILNRIDGAYASDSIVVWTSRWWPESRELDPRTRARLARDPETGWLHTTVPCDNLLSVCNELVCRSIEVGLPFRGALAMGPALLDSARTLFLGPPLIQAATLEREQALIGASLCASFMQQSIPERFALGFDRHLKPGLARDFGGQVLDWPRHWRLTRGSDLRSRIQVLSRDTGSAEVHYRNTLDLIDLSERQERRRQPSAPAGSRGPSLRESHPAYAGARLKTPFRAIRRRR
ncbi:hypothetical protein [Marilutibacter chinensis]|uniref:Guanylate cyclase domain-containing protein n=1 Tax=Marilutibacter chinensis TaxID=2912247 RepID=A0ABS9HQM6_9GAMM|nr:hypothetical protein [Lysobacter chinensis]MCF7220680.1 hypothetical protein [Lysobacter chinensis]